MSYYLFKERDDKELFNCIKANTVEEARQIFKESLKSDELANNLSVTLFWRYMDLGLRDDDLIDKLNIKGINSFSIARADKLRQTYTAYLLKRREEIEKAETQNRKPEKPRISESDAMHDFYSLPDDILDEFMNVWIKKYIEIIVI